MIMQCQECDAKDQVTIAGKTFCANCGTPNATPIAAAVQPNTQPNNNVPSSQSQSGVVGGGNIANNAINNTIAQPTGNINNQSSTSNESLANELTNTLRQQTASSQTPMVTNHIPNPQPPVTTVSNPNPQPIPAQNFSKPPTAPPITQPSVVMAAPTNTPNSTASLNQSTQINSTSVPPASSQPAPSHFSASTNLTNSNINSEFTSLKNKDEEVFSDAQLSALANTNVSGATNPQNPFKAQVQPPQMNQTPPRPISSVPSQVPAQAKPIQDIKTASRPVAAPHPTIPMAPNSNPQPQPPNPTLNAKPNFTQPSPVTSPAIQNRTNSPVPNINALPSRPPTTPTTAKVEDAQIVDNTTPPDKSKKLSGKVASLSLSLAGLVLLGVYVWQINYPNLALKVASSKAGINASLPTYIPNGWKVSGDIQSNPGSVGYEIKSDDGTKKVVINEDRSDWDSDALAENYINTKTKKYTTLQSEGLTIYLYNDNQASWINHGTWYRIEGENHGISKDQIIKMATSL